MVYTVYASFKSVKEHVFQKCPALTMTLLCLSTSRIQRILNLQLASPIEGPAMVWTLQPGQRCTKGASEIFRVHLENTSKYHKCIAQHDFPKRDLSIAVYLSIAIQATRILPTVPLIDGPFGGGIRPQQLARQFHHAKIPLVRCKSSSGAAWSYQ